MTQSPLVSFGRCAHAVALKAKINQLRDRDIMILSRHALEFCAIDRRVREPVLEFIDAYKLGPVEAGKKLENFIISWMRDVAPDVARQTEFEWQARADLK